LSADVEFFEKSDFFGVCLLSIIRRRRARRSAAEFDPKLPFSVLGASVAIKTVATHYRDN